MLFFSNALTLEQVISEYPRAGTLITFIQFLLISAHGLTRFVEFTPYPRLKQRQIPLSPYLLQVFLFYVLSMLNNAAFGYNIPMPVHIIFRSGGLVVSMLLGWILLGRRYNITQVSSVLLVTAGVLLTTLSASHPKSPGTAARSTEGQSEVHVREYATGILFMTTALFLGGFLGIVQDRTYARYGRHRPAKAASNDPKGKLKSKADTTETWQESMFYLHFLSLPLFLFVRHDLVAQVSALNAGPAYTFVLPFPLPYAVKLPGPAQLALPAIYFPLLLNTVTQLLCVAGVNRLTARVSSLTVTLVLVVRKAVSLVISVMLFSATRRRDMDSREKRMLWTGALLVFIGTVGYSINGSRSESRRERIRSNRQDSF
ncbi:UAA transporter [Sparassis latifolia]